MVLDAIRDIFSNNSTLSTLRYPNDNRFRHHVLTTFTLLREETKGDGRTASTTRGTRSVSLYLPKAGFQVEDVASYSGGGIGEVGRFIVDADENAGETGGRILKDFAESVTDAVLFTSGKTAVNDANSAAIAKLLQRARLQDTKVGRAVRTKFGITANPHLRSVFDQVELRKFGFEYDLVPNNAQEAQTVKRIIRFFRENLYPETIGVQDAPDIAYRFPTKFEISYTFQGKRIAHRIKPCYLTRVKTQFNNQGQGLYHDGEFISTKLELGFQEETTLSKKDVQGVDADGALLEDGVGY